MSLTMISDWGWAVAALTGIAAGVWSYFKSEREREDGE
jgi:hypothetical protein